jgi:alpha-glucoside transport system substrate-binding protein
MHHPIPSRRKALVGTALAAALSLSLAACGGDSGGSSGGDDKSVTIWTSMDQPIVDGFETTLAEKAKAAGITVKWERVTDINTIIMTKLNSNDKPDIAVIPQPGVVANIVQRGSAIALDDVLDMSTLEGSMLPGVVEAGTVDGKYYGLQINANVKSLVFYPKKAWDAAGYPIPKSLDELEQLTDQIKGDGNTPWCMGIESDTATGWPATDWFEDLVARFGGADTYAKWVTHEVPFTDDAVKQAGEYFDKLLFTEGNVLGGREAIASTNFGTAGNPMFDAKPGCWMYKQGTFITGFFPKSVQSNLDAEVGVFGFPPATVGGENPVVGGGDFATMLSDDADTKDVMKMLSETDIGAEAAKTGAYISPHKDFDPSAYPNEIMKTAYTVATGASSFLIDGSDQMPGEVGAGTFWKEITSWVTDQQDLDTALSNIDASWPAS